MPTRPFSLLLWLLFFKTLVIACLIYSEAIGLGPDEAQYWTWSQQLSFGYYSKPPGIAWQIALGTGIFGNSEFGVRFVSLLIGFFLPIVTYGLARGCRLLPTTSFWAACVMAFSPLGILASFFAITDGGLVLFWALAMLVVCRSLDEDKNSLPHGGLPEKRDLSVNCEAASDALCSSALAKARASSQIASAAASQLTERPLFSGKPPYYTLGLVLLCGALFKWPIYLFWLLIVALVIWKRHLYSHRLFAGIGISLLGLLPSLFWNMQEGFPTFRHVFSTLYGKETVDTGTTMLLKGNFLEFFGAQGLLLSPILFFCLLAAFVALVRSWKSLNLALQFCGASTLSLLVVHGFFAFFKKMQGNWCDFAYPSACVLIAWFACQKSKRTFYWMVAGVISSVVFVAVLFAFPQPFKHNLGWKILGKTLSEVGYDPTTNFLFGDKYQMSSLLSFYGPDQKRAYFLNLQNIRKNQFSYWPGMEVEQLGKDGFFVIAEKAQSKEEADKIEKHYEESLAPYFKEVRFLGVYPLVFFRGMPLKNAYIFSCIGYNGKLPPDSNTY